MIIIVGLVILVAAVAGVAGNGGSAHAQPLPGARLPRDRLRRPLFLYGIVAVAIAMLGLSLLLASARRTARRGRAARRGLRQSRRETAVAAHDRDDLLDQRDTARAYTASSLGSDTPAGSRHPRQPPHEHRQNDRAQGRNDQKAVSRRLPAGRPAAAACRPKAEVTR